MACEHKRLRCTDGVFYCLDCGAVVDPPKAEATDPKPKQRKRRKDESK